MTITFDHDLAVGHAYHPMAFNAAKQWCEDVAAALALATLIAASFFLAWIATTLTTG